MPIAIFVDDLKDLTTFDCFGDVFFDDFIEPMIMFYEEINLSSTSKLILDMRKIDNFDLSQYQLDKLVDLYISKNNGARTAILSSSKQVIELANIFRTKVSESKRNIKVFQSKYDGDKWLGNGTMK